MNRLMAVVIGLTATANAAQAIEVTGGMIDLSYSAFIDETELSKSTLTGSIELAFNQIASAQLDIGRDSFGFSDLANLSLGVHGIYHMNSNTSLGAFYTHDKAEVGGLSDTTNLYGIEAGHDTGLVDIEGYLGRGKSSEVDGTLVGISGRYGMPNRIGLTGSIDYLDIEGVEVSKIALKLDGDLSENLNLYVEVGQAKVSAFGSSESEPFMGIGGRITFGADRGTTFERRSLGDLLPGL
tara:strand:+ start:2238 stop:2954 length:717 start_codon:yes stop_codon:yes gene_type:complete